MELMTDPLGTLQAITRALRAVALREATSGADRYRFYLRQNVRGYWSGQLDFVGFYNSTEIAIEQGLTGAWREGAKDMGVNPDELTPTELAGLENMIRAEQSHIADLAERIEAGSKANGGKLQPLFDRVEGMWVLRYQDARNRARAMAGADKKLEWVMNPRKEHCSSCLKLSGKVKRSSQWLAAGVLPQNPPNDKLECKGFKCGCELKPTDKPISKGPLPRLP
jgi:hypothetical protein